MPLALVPIQVGVPGGMELAVLLLVAALLFGADKLPEVARSTGKALGEYRRGRLTAEEELQAGENEQTRDANESNDEPGSSNPDVANGS